MSFVGQKKGDDLGSLDGSSPMAKALSASCRLNSFLSSLGFEFSSPLASDTPKVTMY